MGDSLCPIEQLLKHPFHLHSVQEKLNIVKSQRPCPEMPKLFAVHLDKEREYFRHFQTSQYQKIQWIAGSEKLNKLFCWPCLMFSKEETVWSKNGYDNLNNLHNAINKHEKSQAHIFSVLQFKLFGSSRIDLELDLQLQVSAAQHNEVVQKNREILKRFIDTVCFFAIHELPFRGHCESGGAVDKGVYFSALNYLAKYDATLSVHLETSPTFHGTSNQIQNDLILAVRDVVMDKIKQELSHAPFVAIMLDETADAMNLSQLSTTLRYINSENGEINERFISFIDISSDSSTNGFFEYVQSIATEYDLSNKLVAQTFDGAAVMAGHSNGLRAKVLEKYPKAIFVHRFSHKLNLILFQSLSCLKGCRIFLQTLTGLGSFFSKSSKRTERLKEYTSKKLPKHSPTRWNFTSHVVQTVKEHREVFIGFFQDILEDSSTWDSETVVTAQGFLKFLTSLETSLLLVVFSRIFSHPDILFNIHQPKLLDIQYCCEKIAETRTNIQNLKKMWESVWTETVAFHHEDDETPSKRHRTDQDSDPEVARKALYNEIIDTIIFQIDERFSSMHSLKFVALLDPRKYEEYKVRFPASIFNILKETHSETFDFVRLRNELIVLYSYEEFSGQYPYQLVTTLKKKQLDTALPEVYKLGLLIVTIPSTTAVVEQTFSSLRRIKTYQRSTQSQEHLTGLALLSIEKGLLVTLMQSVTFYEEVINKFTKQERRMDFTYK